MCSNIQRGTKKRDVDTIFNRSSIEIFIKSKVADFHLTQNTMPSILISFFFLRFIRYFFWCRSVRRGFFPALCSQFYGFCVETRRIELYISFVVVAPCKTFHRLSSLLSNSFSLDIIDISCNE